MGQVLFRTIYISPRGLRILKTCSFLASELSNEWSQISEFCTQKWMRVIIQEREPKYLGLVEQIKSNISHLSTLMSTLPISWLNTLKHDSKKNEDTLIQTKLGKMRRDLDDFNLGRVFNWKKSHRVPNTNYTSNPSTHLMPLMQCIVGPPGPRPWPPPRHMLLSHPMHPTSTNPIIMPLPSSFETHPLTPKPQ